MNDNENGMSKVTEEQRQQQGQIQYENKKKAVDRFIRQINQNKILKNCLPGTSTRLYALKEGLAPLDNFT